MRYFLDTEFIERPCEIQLISLGIVAEDTSAASSPEFPNGELYIESADFNEDDACDWVKENVIVHLKKPTHLRVTNELGGIKDHILRFIGEDKTPEFWGYYADYDWVAFCWTFGRMIDLPRHFPKYCRDLKQWLDEVGNPRVPFKPDEEHNALSDARWNKKVYEWLNVFPTSETRTGPGSTFITDTTE
jgi:hypothetical protein